MPQLAQAFALLSASVFFWSCASSTPPSRIVDYIPANESGDGSLLTEQRPLKAGLVLISDTSAPEAAPNLPDEAMVKLGEELRDDISRVLPVTITSVIPAEGIRSQDGNRAHF